MYEANHKNIFILGVALVFMIIFWSYNQFENSHINIKESSDPNLSIERGKVDAFEDFKENHAEFKIFNDKIPGLDEAELESKYENYVPYRGFMCGFGSYFEGLKLELSGYEYNLYYVHSYNAELRRLIEK